MTDRRMARAAAQLHDAAQASVAAREAESQAAEAEAGTTEQRQLRQASRLLRDLAGYRITQAGRIAAGRVR